MTTTDRTLDYVRENLLKSAGRLEDHAPETGSFAIAEALVYVGDCIRYLADRFPDGDAVFHPSVLRQEPYEGEARCLPCRSLRIATCLHPLEPGEALTIYDDGLRRESSE